jgi:hypothetical protein
MRQIDFSYSAYYTQEYKKYDNIWQIHTVKWMSTLTQDKYLAKYFTIEFNRVVRNYMFTLPSYIVYMLTLLMFVLPQTSNQRILIGKLLYSYLI